MLNTQLQYNGLLLSLGFRQNAKLFKDLFYFKNYVYVCASVCAGALGTQKKTLDLLELELPVVVSHPMSKLGNELGSSARIVSAVNH